ncbi:GntR family transcriptional regulator [Phyllobacterium sp. SB3]|uniref:GntR family transcriptional regulator n=1 Tax=Phyllobacterium sp. SB3 TaxID=3156073 RepID=UPI0032AFDFDF
MKRITRLKRALANEIADAIHLGEFRAGEWLRQIDLEQKFKATRFDVRAALEELVIRKTIQHIPNRGYQVSILDDETMISVQETRVILESAAAGKVATNTDADALRRLEALAQQFTQAVKSGTAVDHSSTNREFHRLFYSLCGNPVLEETIWSLRDRSRASPLTTWQSYNELNQANEDHYEMLDAIRHKDAQRLSDIVTAHIIRNKN